MINNFTALRINIAIINGFLFAILVQCSCEVHKQRYVRRLLLANSLQTKTRDILYGIFVRSNEEEG